MFLCATTCKRLLCLCFSHQRVHVFLVTDMSVVFSSNTSYGDEKNQQIMRLYHDSYDHHLPPLSMCNCEEYL